MSSCRQIHVELTYTERLAPEDIPFPYGEERQWGVWTGHKSAALMMACAALSASRLNADRYCYWDDSAHQHYVVGLDALAMLGAALMAGHKLESVYSSWCAAVDLRERRADDGEAEEEAPA